MSAAKHTPGPWRAIDPNSSAFTEEWTCHEDTHAHSVWQPIVDARCKAVALVVDANSDFGDRASFDADARLIAAAPELLEACANARDMLAIDRQAFVDCHQVRGLRTEEPIAHGLVFVEEGVWITPEDAEALRDYDKAIALIDAAIAKSTGGAA